MDRTKRPEAILGAGLASRPAAGVYPDGSGDGVLRLRRHHGVDGAPRDRHLPTGGRVAGPVEKVLSSTSYGRGSMQGYVGRDPGTVTAA